MHNQKDPDEAKRIVPLFRLAFRPFFLGAALFSLIALTLWGVFWITGLEWVPYGGWIWWHAHEMLFGFVVAIIIGFLLTAVQAWTGQASISSWPLAGLFALWLLPRILLLYPIKAMEALLPWLAWAMSIDEWNENWSAASKRTMLKQSVAIHKHKGTVGAVKRALKALNIEFEFLEWFEQSDDFGH